MVIYEIVKKISHKVQISLFNGDWLELDLPEEADRSDFWAGAWITQMANIRRKRSPRNAALLVQHQGVIPPWTKLSDIANTG